MTYSDIMIWSLDREFIKNISDKYDVDYCDADIYLEDISSAKLTNQIIYYILSQAVYNLDTTDRVKDYLSDSIFANCFDSFYNTYDDMINELDRTDEEKAVAIEHIKK
jgi:hypothetical protein